MTEPFRFRHLEIARPVAFLDLETTGIDPAFDRIVEWTVLRFEPGFPYVEITRRCNPGMPITVGASAIHGITDQDVADHPSFASRAEELAGWLAGADLSGFGIDRFDLPILLAEFHRIDPRYFTGPQPGLRRLDVMSVYHAIAPYDRRRRRTLTRAVETYCGRRHEGAHGSAADALAAAEVLDGIIAAEWGGLPIHFDALCQRWGHVPPGTPPFDPHIATEG